MADDLTLASDFPAPTRDDWLEAVGKALRGADFDKTLVSATDDDITIQPLYISSDVDTEMDEAGFPSFAPLIRGDSLTTGVHGSWDIRATVTHPDPATANTQALEDLTNGATSLDVIIDTAGTGTGISCRDSDDLARALHGIDRAAAPLSLRAGAHGAIVAGWYLDQLDSDGATSLEPAGCLGVDPIGVLTRTGHLPQGLDAAIGDGIDLSRRTVAQSPRVRTFLASGAAASEAGASEGQEIALTLAAATYYLRAMTDAGLSPREAAGQIVLELSADVDVFATVAKFRALRHCWSTILSSSGVDLDAASPDLVHVVAVSADRWMTQVDPWVNLLRGTAATLGAVMGGADVVTIAAFDGAAGLPGHQGRRLARNTQLLLQEESGIGRVLDPAGGSWYVESLTDELARLAWAGFQRIEAAGGPLPVLADGSLAGDIAEVADARAQKIATRRRPITGVSEFPQLGEDLPDASPAPPADTRPGIELTGTPTTVTPLPRRRLAEPFERLRTAAAGADVAPTVFLATLGPVATHTARATFAANLFAAGGIAVTDGTVLDGPTAAAQAFTDSGASVACLCSSDAVYAESAVPVAEALKAAGASRVYLAGKPGGQEAQWRAAGIDDFIHVGVDVLATLQELHEELEIR